MSIVYTADIFCDVESCGQWTHGCTSSLPPLKREARQCASDAARWLLNQNGNDYCPRCRPKYEKSRS